MMRRREYSRWRDLMAACMLLMLPGTTLAAQNPWPDLSQSPTSPGGGEKDAAVIVGIEKYTFVAEVPGAQRNAEDWHTYLTESRELPAEKVALLRDTEATLEDIRASAAIAASEVAPGGTLWVVFIGHGAPSQDGKDGLLVGADAQDTIESLHARSLPVLGLSALIAKGKQARTVMILDASFTGRSSSGQALAAGLQPLMLTRLAPTGHDRRTILMTAAKSGQLAGALPGSDPPRPAFSYLALGALRGWAADKRGYVRAGSVIDLARRVLRLARDHTQTPELTLGSPQTILSIGREPAPDLGRIARDAARLERSPRTSPSPTANDATIEWVTIPGGSFMMGTDLVEPARPVHKVRVPAFQMAKTVVTNKQYRACVEAGRCTAPYDCYDSRGGHFKDENQPVVCVDWDQAKTFSEWAGGRLPSEAEWEYAARGAGKNWIHPWGEEEPNCDFAVIDDRFAGPGCGHRATWPVCSKPKGNTPQGLCDMVGNVAQWVQDLYHPSYVGAPTDGSAWGSPSDIAPDYPYNWNYVLKGSSWQYSSCWNLQSACRLPYSHHDRYDDYIGFRPARSLP
jgi:iron(II)-dependent oxidoreductase